MAGTVIRFIGAAIGTFVLLVVELVLTMLAYTYLNLYNLPLFGYLVRQARHILDFMTSQFVYWLPASADVAYATLLGELGPKAILLLLLGLSVAAVMRLVVGLLKPLFSSSY